MSAATATAPRRIAGLSPATAAIGGVLVALTILYAYLNTRMYAETLSDGAYTASYVFGTLLHSLFAIVIISSAVKMGVRQRVGMEWLLIGLGVVMYGIGDLVWMRLELILQVDPYPSLADVFYTLEYPLFFVALVMAVRSHRGLAPLKLPTIIGGAVGLAALAAIYATVLGPYILPAGTAELGFWGLVVSVLYPIGDVFFMLAPAVTLALVITRLGAGRLARPWWIVVVGAFVFAVADTVYSYADWSGLGTTTFTDMGWLTANLLFALAALAARDVFRTA
jgi:hypothetical protein